jgi:hypothetical protein
MVQRNRVTGIFTIVLGAPFVAWGLSDERLHLLWILGASYLIFGIYGLVSVQKRGDVA